jgi:hypothetical protein
MNYPKIKIVPVPKIPTANELRVNAEDLLSVDDRTGRIREDSTLDIDGPEPRDNGLLKGHGFWLSQTVDWVIVKDDKEALVLVPLKKKN